MHPIYSRRRIQSCVHISPPLERETCEERDGNTECRETEIKRLQEGDEGEVRGRKRGMV